MADLIYQNGEGEVGSDIRDTLEEPEMPIVSILKNGNVNIKKLCGCEYIVDIKQMALFTIGKCAKDMKADEERDFEGEN